MAGAVSVTVGGTPLLAITAAAAAILMALSYWRLREADDPGMTTELALVFTVLLGALAMRAPTLAAGTGVVTASLLAARTRLHHFVGAVVTEQEARHGLLIATATLVVLPLLPDRTVGPYSVLNPHAIWVVVLLVLAIGAAGHILVRALGPRFGLPLAGLASGFVSSTATIAAMGAQASKGSSARPAAAGAVLSTLATIGELALVVGATSVPVLRVITPSLVAAGLAAAAYGGLVTLLALRSPRETATEAGQAFSPATALVFGVTLSIVLVGSAALRATFGEIGAIAAAAIAGLVDPHAASISIASLVAAGRLTPAEAILPILVALSTNTAIKILLAITTGGGRFALQVVPGLVLVVAAAWGGWVLDLSTPP